LSLDISPQFGFAGRKLEGLDGWTPDGIGDEKYSWGVDGVRGILWHEGKRSKYACRWRAGDVVGLACDMVEGEILASVNGSFEEPNGRVARIWGCLGSTGCLAPMSGLRRYGNGLYPAISGKTGTIKINLGAASFRYSPPKFDTAARHQSTPYLSFQELSAQE
jgi:hypothetical protein